MTTNDRPHRVHKPFFTFGTLTLLIFMGIGFAFGLTRLFLGLGSVTNLDDRNPWGIWIAFDVACGVALAAGGFTTAALVEIFGRRRFRPLLRPALLTAFLGYLWVVIALSFDLGRYWNIWRPIFNWQGNSVLFEVGMCVTFYLLVLAVEMSPAILEGLRARMDEGGWGAALLGKAEGPVTTLQAGVRVALPIFIVAGVVLSFMHQSSLGALMLISPTKMSPLWYTPILPLLFLLSAIMVGFPMVILESIYASISFGRNPEMKLLAPLARLVVWLVGIYGVVKLSDLVYRWSDLDLVGDPARTIALLVELVVGVIAPLALLHNRAVQRSMGWLFFAISLVIFGVVLNRINVFLVAYQPPYMVQAYFPSLGELALTVAIVSSILFCYRFFVTFFPILPGYVPASEAELDRIREGRARTVSPFWTWAIRGSAIALLLAFVGLYISVHEEAIVVAGQTVEEVRRVKATEPAHEPAASAEYPQRPSAYRNFYVLESPVLNAQADDYEPVLFAHRIHDELTGGDCGVCHHRYAWVEDDRVGEDIAALHAAFDVRLGGPCAACHDDMEANPPQSCFRCHGLPNEVDDPGRIGLKGAYHRQCMGCHQRQIQPAPAPTECHSCHHPWTPDHSTLVDLQGTPTPREVTRACLECHARTGTDLLSTAHWNWKGRSPALIGHEHRTDISLTSIASNACLDSGPGARACGSCHIGYGKMEAGFDVSDPTLIDCLVCHDTTGTYVKDPLGAGMPEPSVDLVMAASKVGRPGRRECGSCHFASGGAPNAKHGDLEPILAEPPADYDVHMGMLDMRCQACHTTTRHRIAGRSMSAPAVEGRVRCEQCHGSTPHGVSGLLSRHLDDHIRTVACETCHIPLVARTSPTLLRRDLSVAGEEGLGETSWGEEVVPEYLWDDGMRHVTLLGDTIDPDGTVDLNRPAGEKRDPAARIFPFKAHTAVQPYDTETQTLVLPDLAGVDPGDPDWQRAISEGMKKAGLPYSGQYGFVETRMYSSIHHGVVPARRALGCADCHRPAAVTCVRCHRDAAGMELPEHTRPVYPETGPRLDFEALEYDDDPAMVGGRFFLSLGRGSPPR